MKLLVLVIASFFGKAFATMDKEQTKINQVLDRLHQYASEAKGDAYFALFSEDAIFFGTDPDERWTIQQFRSYALPHFQKNKGWTYTPVSRNIYINATTAWFDEKLHNEKYGHCRGTGSLVRFEDSSWRIVQYNLSLPIPNRLTAKFVEEIKNYQQKKPPKKSNP